MTQAEFKAFLHITGFTLEATMKNTVVYSHESNTLRWVQFPREGVIDRNYRFHDKGLWEGGKDTASFNNFDKLKKFLEREMQKW